MSMIETINKAREARDFETLIQSVPYARTIGMECLSFGNELMFILPKRESNIGNPTLPAIHGGVIGGFMENAAIFHVLGTIETSRIPKVVDFSLDYLRAGRYQPSFATCQVVRQGRKVVNVSVSCWQDSRDKVIATARTHLLL